MSRTATLLEHRGPAAVAELARIRSRVAAALGGTVCGKDLARDVVLAVDEACQNVIRHAYGEGESGELVLTLNLEGESLVVLLRDFAKTVDPAKIRPRDLDDLRPGGLGTHFINQVMDEVAFLPPPDGRGNLLRMVKRIDRMPS